MGLDLAHKTLASSLSEGIRDSEKTHGVADASCKKMASNSENTPFNSHLWACKDTACLGSRDRSQHARAGGAWEGSGIQLQHEGSLPATPLSWCDRPLQTQEPVIQHSQAAGLPKAPAFPPESRKAALLQCHGKVCHLVQWSSLRRCS